MDLFSTLHTGIGQHFGYGFTVSYTAQYMTKAESSKLAMQKTLLFLCKQYALTNYEDTHNYNNNYALMLELWQFTMQVFTMHLAHNGFSFWSAV